MLYLPEQMLKLTTGRSRSGVIRLYHAEYRVCFDLHQQLQTEAAGEIAFLRQQLQQEQLGLHAIADWNRKYRHDLQHRESTRPVQTVKQRPLAALRHWQQEKADE